MKHKLVEDKGLKLAVARERVMTGGRGVKFWAWTASVGAHVILLTAFAVVKVSSLKAQSQQVTPAAKVVAVKRMMESQPATPKPKVKPAVKDAIVTANRPAVTLGDSGVFQINRPDMVERALQKQEPAEQKEILSANTEVLQEQTEFFGSKTNERRICYIVDCSGSMLGLWRQVRSELVDSIAQLQPDEYFCVIAFGGDRIMESGGGRIVRATEKAKKEAYDFIGSLRPAGTTNALAAMEKAVKVRDTGGVGPGLIYFLTDGFELGDEDAGRFADRMMVMLRGHGSSAKVNTIGFWPGEQDRRLLERIAKQTGGECTIVDEDVKGDVWDQL